MRRVIGITLASVVLAAAAADCGSSDEAAATGPGGTGGSRATGGSSGTGGRTGTGGSGTGGSAGATGGSGGGAVTDSGTGGTSTTDGGGQFAPGGSTTSLPCGSASCTIPAQTCCVDATGNTPVLACVNAKDCASVDGGSNPKDSVALKCTGSANCDGGKVCCVTSNKGAAFSECLPTCGQGSAQLCDPAAASAGCGDAGACSNDNIGDWGLPDTFATCGGVEH